MRPYKYYLKEFIGESMRKGDATERTLDNLLVQRYLVGGINGYK